MAIMVLLLLFAAASRYAMTWLPDVQAYLENTLSEKTGATVTIESLTGRVEGFYPVFALRNVTVQAHDEGKAPLTLQQANLSIDWWRTLTSFKPRIKLVWLSGADVHLVVSPKGNVHLRGWDEQESSSVASHEDLAALLALAYEQQRVLLENISVRFELPDMPAFETHDLALALIKEGRQRYATAALSAVDEPLALDVRLRLDNTAADWRSMIGQAYVRLRGERIERWLPRSSWLYQPAHISGTLELWGALQQRGAAKVVAALSDGELTLQHQEEEGEWLLENASLLLSVERTQKGYRAHLGELSGHSAAGGQVKLGPLSLSTMHHSNRWAVRGENISINELVRHGQAWPFPLPDIAQQVFATQPQGDVSVLALSGQRQQLEAIALRFTEVAVGAEQTPNIAGLSGWLSGTAQQGIINLEPSQLTLGLPAVFADALSARAKAAAHWQRTEKGLEFSTGEIQLNNADVQEGSAKVKLWWPAKGIPQLSLRGTIAKGDAAAAVRYIPLQKLPTKVSEWLASAFVDGQVNEGQFFYEGAIRAIDSAPMERDFLMRFDVRDTTLHVAPGWPEFTHVTGAVDIGISPRGIDVTGEQLDAQFLGQTLSDVALNIHGSASTPTALAARGQHKGTAGTLSQLFNNTPISKALPAALREWAFDEGEVAGNVQLALPLHPQAPPLGVEVESRFTDATLGSDALGLTFTQLSGDGTFSLNKGFRSEQFTGELLGRTVTGRATSNDDITHVSLVGSTSVAALRRWQDNPLLAYVKGEFPYQFSLTLPRNDKHQAAWRLYSSLKGTELTLPAPFSKPAASTLPFNVSWRQQNQRKPLLQMALENTAQGEFVLAKGQVQRGHLHLGKQRAALPSSGLLVDGAVEEIDLTAWVRTINQHTKRQSTPTHPLVRLALQANNIRFGDLGDAGHGQLSAREASDAWDVRMQTERITGELWWPKEYQLRGHRPLTANIDEIHWPLANRRLSLGIFSAADGQITAQQMPIADVRLNQVYWQERDLGGWQAQLRPHAQGTRFAALQGRWQESRLEGEMDWLATPGKGEETRIIASLTSEKLEQTLASVGLAGFLESKKASADVTARWQGGPIHFDYRKLFGTARVEVEKAYLPGDGKHTSALRMLGVLNIGHTLGRRLRLDFSDVVQKGLVVDKLTGDYHLAGPALTTTNLRIVSPSAEFNVAGQLNLNEGLLDSGIEVTLPLSSNLYAGCLAGPVACAGVFVVERLWGNRLEKLTSMDYQVTGPWQSPKVDDVNGIYQRKREQYERFINE